MKTQLPLLPVLLVFFTIKTFSQTPTLFPSIQSPNAASFKAGVESPVTLDVGKIGVSLPLYTVQDKDLVIPLTLKYNSSGVKPDIHPGWVGQGWNLNAGMITRNVKGVPDELYWKNENRIYYNGSYSGTVANTQARGYAYNSSINEGADWNTTTRITDLAKAADWKEAEPDEFFYSCGNYSGSFYLTHEGTVVAQGNPDVLIEGDFIYNYPYMFDPDLPFDPLVPASYTYLESSGGINNFNRSFIAKIKGYKITTPDGIEYEFGNYGRSFSPYLDEFEFTVDLFDQFYSSEIFTSWYLTRVNSLSTGAAINLTYVRGNPVMQVARSFSFYKTASTGAKKGFYDWIFGPVSSYSENAREEMTGRLIRPTYLTSIETSDTQIDLTTSPSNQLKYNYAKIVEEIAQRSQYYNTHIAAPYLFSRFPIGVCYFNTGHPGFTHIITYAPDAYRIYRGDGLTEDLDFSVLRWEKLDFISIREKGSAFYTKTYNFKYTSSDTQRLQLLSVHDSSTPNPYIFNYDASATLPVYNSMKIDHWGYFNDTFVDVDPTSVTSLTNYKSLREPVDSKLYAGMLTKVTYPTKGYKEFTYEPNKYKSVVTRNTTTGAFSIAAISTAKSGGGLRIKEVKEVSGNGQPDLVTSYEYGDGLLNGDIQYYWPGYTGKLFNGTTYTSDRFITESLLPTIENAAGGIVSYSRVTEKMTGLGRKEYDFKSFITNPDVNGNSIDPQKSPYSPFSSKSLERGLISEVRTYDNTTTLPLVKEAYTYQANPGLINFEARAVQSKGLKLFDGATQINAIEGTSYTNYLYPYQKKTKQTQILDKVTSTYASTQEEYGYDNDAMYDNDNQLKELKITNADGSVSTTKLKHTWDYTLGSLGTAYTEAEGISMLYDKHIINRPLLTEVRFKKSGATLDSVTSVTLNTYRKYNNFNGSLPVLHKTYKLETPSPVPSYTLTLNASSMTLDNKLKLQTHFTEYWGWGQIAETVTGFSKNTAIWGYNGRFLVAITRNSSRSSVAYTSFEDGGYGWQTLNNKTLDPTAVTGKYVYNLVSSSGGSVSTTGLDNTKKYLLTFWVKGSTIPTITTGGAGVPGESSIIRTYNGWTQCKSIIVSSTSVTLSGNNLLIDELRLHPVEASMTSYTYNPQVGMTSMTDERGAITYYDYDSASQLRSIRDLQGNIVKKFDYNYKP